jgi:small conductance mechanosensitive channel
MDATLLTGQFSIFLSQLTAWVAAALPHLVGAIILLVVGLWLAGWADRAVRQLIASRVEPTLSGTLGSVTRYGIVIMVMLAVLAQLGVQTTSVLAALGAAGLAIGLAMQGTLSNIAAGMMLLWLRPFKVGDEIETSSVAGTIKEVGLFASELQSGDGVFLFVPNSQLWNTRIINYSRLPTRLIDPRFGVGYDNDLGKGKLVLLDLASAETGVHKEPAPQVFVKELGDSAIVLELLVWAATSDYWTLRRMLTERGKEALERAGLSLPFPQRVIHLHQSPRGLDTMAPLTGPEPM